MKTIKYVLSLALVFFLGCSDDEDLSFINSVTAPSNVSAQFLLSQDNTGLVTIIPNSEGGVSYKITLGDGTTEPVSLDQGEHIEHIYAEGTYAIGVEATGITGLKTEASQNLVVSFRAPENIQITAEIDPSNPFRVNVSATADYAASFLVFFDTSDPDEEGTPLTLEGTVSHEYPAVGDYTIKVVALSGGAETSELTQVVTVSSPVELPIDFEIFDASVFQGFGGASNAVIDNPDTNGNGSATVGQIVKNGPEVWAGNVITLSAPIDFSVNKLIKMDVWSPRPGGRVLLKVENLTDGGIFFEKEVTTLGNSAWEEVSFDLSDIDTANTYQKIVLFFDFGLVGDGTSDWTFFIDNIRQASLTYTALLYDDFEGNGNITTWLGDAAGMTLDSPNVVNESINTSLTVLKYEDTGGQYANVQFVADGKFDLTGGQSVFALKIYVPSSSITGSQPNQISLKLQNSDLGGNSWQTQTEIIKPITLDTWQLVTFDFATDAFINLDGGSPDPVDRTDLDKVVIQVNSENNFDSVTAYIDDFAYGTTPPEDTPPFATDDFEGNGTITAWLGDAAGADTAYANPIDGNIEGMNYSSTVLFYEDTGGQYANVQFTVTPKFDLTAKSKFTLKLYVPSSSISGTQPNQISLKLQNSDLGGNSWQTQTEIIKPIVLDAWQEVTFDFVNDNFINLDGGSPDPIERTDLDKVVIQLNSENNNDTVSAYIDDFNYHK